MSQNVDLFRNVYSKQQYKNVVDVDFTDATVEQTQQEVLPSITQFFDYYNKLFYQIPKTGEESHTTLITQSEQYVGNEKQSAEIDALVQEINGLRQVILEQQQTILQLTTNG